MANLVPTSRTDHDLFAAEATSFQNALDDFFAGGWGAPRRAFLRNAFKVDVEDRDKDYVVTAEMPGAKKDDISVDMDDGRLTIAVTKETKTEEEKKNYLHKERSVSSMSRSMYLSDAATEGLEAKLDDGVLTVTVPKAEPSTKTSVEVK